MILGVYWAFKFPEGLYSFDFFKFRGTTGGFDQSPSELYIDCKIENSDSFIEKLARLIKKYPYGQLFIFKKNNSLRLIIGSYTLFDYDFLLAQNVEALLKTETVSDTPISDLNDNILIKLIGEKRQEHDSLPKKGFLQIVGSELSQYNSELSAIRFDCNISYSEKTSFLKDLTRINKEESINVFFYTEKKAEDRLNLMMFFSSGRQGLNLRPMQIINGCSLEDSIQDLRSRYSLEFGFTKYSYPHSKRKDVLMVDKEFMPSLNKK